MSKKFLNLLVVSFLCVGLLISLVDSAQAQDPIVTPTPTPVSVATAHPLASSDTDIVTFELLEQTEMELIGPYDSASFSFDMPPDWAILEGASLNLLMGVAFNTDAQRQLGPFAGVSGTLTVRFNGELLAVLPLNNVGEIERVLPIPINAFTAIRDDGRMVLSISLDNRIACDDRYRNERINVFIHQQSYFNFPHESIQPATNLENFPRPIFQDSFSDDFALLVIPDQPSAAELQAALTVAAGLGNITDNNLIMDMTTLGGLTSEQIRNTNIIYIGGASSLPVLSELDLPQPVSEGKFQIAESEADDGVIQMINSPWSNAHVILVVSGNTDQGVIKAGQAIGSSVLLTSHSPNLAVVQQVQVVPVPIAQQTSQTLTDLGYEGWLFQYRGGGTESYNFYIPPGMTVAPDAYLELVYAHSALLNFDRSGIVVVLNGSPIGSVRLSESTAGQATNRVKITLPASAIKPGNNFLEMKVSLLPPDICETLGMQGIWINLWPETTLYLPLIPAPVNLVSNLDLAAYPAPFVYDPMLGSTAFVLAHNDLESWRLALQMAAFLGQSARGPLSALSVFYADEISEAEREQYNLLVVGSPSQLSIMDEMNSFLPAPFADGSDNAAMEDSFQVTYRIPSDSPLGYVQMMSSPWNTYNVVLAVLGNQTQGVSWAASSLIDPKLRSRLAGNFAVVNASQIMTSDTRLSPTLASVSTQVPGVEVVLPVGGNDDMASLDQSLAIWVLPTLIASIALIVLILAVVAFRKWMRIRTRIRTQKTGQQQVSKDD